jgi:hypothetical protein
MPFKDVDVKTLEETIENYYFTLSNLQPNDKNYQFIKEMIGSHELLYKLTTNKNYVTSYKGKE